jgi:hypothetical protein
VLSPVAVRVVCACLCACCLARPRRWFGCAVGPADSPCPRWPNCEYVSCVRAGRMSSLDVTRVTVSVTSLSPVCSCVRDQSGEKVYSKLETPLPLPPSWKLDGGYAFGIRARRVGRGVLQAPSLQRKAKVTKRRIGEINAAADR